MFRRLRNLKKPGPKAREGIKMQYLTLFLSAAFLAAVFTFLFSLFYTKFDLASPHKNVFLLIIIGLLSGFFYGLAGRYFNTEAVLLVFADWTKNSFFAHLLAGIMTMIGLYHGCQLRKLLNKQSLLVPVTGGLIGMAVALITVAPFPGFFQEGSGGLLPFMIIFCAFFMAFFLMVARIRNLLDMPVIESGSGTHKTENQD